MCFSKIENKSFHHLIDEVDVCNKCFSSLNPIFKKFKIGKINSFALYRYDESMKSLIYQLKGCGDVELAGIYSFELRLRYFGYTMVCLPSFEGDYQKRGFKHVDEMFSCLKLKKYDCLYKSEHHKQSDQSFKERQEIKKYIFLEDGSDLSGKKILLVDDICTTGSTLKAAINLLEKCNPKKIEVLVVAKREFSKEEIKEVSKFIDVLK